MSIHELIIYGIAGVNSLALLIGSSFLNSIRTKLENLAARDDHMLVKINELDVRTTRIETVNDERLKMIEDIHNDLNELTREVKSIRAQHEATIRKLFEEYDLKRK